MKISEVPFAVLRFHYQLARFPLQVIEDKLGDAAEKRSDADRVAQLAANEKRQRQEERAND